MKNRIVFVTHAIAHYNESLYLEILKDTQSEYFFIGANEFEGIKNVSFDNNCYFLPWGKYMFYGGLYCYRIKNLFETIRKLKPNTIVISGIDFHLPQTLILFLYYLTFTKVKTYWWSHATVGKQGKLGIQLRAFFYRLSHGVFPYSGQGKKNLLSMGVKEYNITVLGNCLNFVDYGCFRITELVEKKLLQRSSSLKIIFVGRIIDKTKLEYLIDAIEILNRNEPSLKIECKIIGIGNELDKYKKLVSSNKLGTVFSFEGKKYGSELDEYFMWSDFMVYPGAIGLTLLHSFSYGTPVITSDDSNIHGPEIELIEPFKTDFLYQHENVSDLAKKILLLKEKTQDSALYNEIITKCTTTIIDYGYTPTIVAQKLLAVINED